MKSGILPFLGLGFLCAWVYSSFFTAALAPTSEADYGTLGVYWLLSLFAVSTCLLALTIGDQGLGGLCSRMQVQYGAAACISIGTILIALGVSFDSQILFFIGSAGAVFTGMGASVLYIAWGSLYCSIGSAETERAVSVAIFIALFITLLMFAIRGWGTIIIVAALPLLSVALLRRAIERAKQRPEGEGKTAPRQDIQIMEGTFQRRAAMVMALLWFIFTYLRDYAAPKDFSASFGSYFITILAGVIVAFIVVCLFLANTRHLSFLAVYKIVIPLTCISLLLALLLPKDLAQISYALGFSCLISFDLYAWILSVKTFEESLTSKVRSVGFFRFAIQVGSFFRRTLCFIPFIV